MKILLKKLWRWLQGRKRMEPVHPERPDRPTQREVPAQSEVWLAGGKEVLACGLYAHGTLANPEPRATRFPIPSLAVHLN